MGISAMVSTVFFTLAHWMFANKYWLLSYKIPSMIDQSVQTPDLTFPKRVNVVMIISSILTGVISTGIFFGTDFGILDGNLATTFFLYFFLMA